MRSAVQPLASALYAGVLVLALASVVCAHGGDEDMGMDMGGMMPGHGNGNGHGNGHGHGSDAPADADIKVYPPTYFSHPEHRGLIYAHITLMTIAWVFVLPVAVMFSLARSRYSLPSQVVFLAVNGGGVLFSVLYNASTPDLFPNNAHHKVAWVATWVVIAQVVVGLLARVAGAFSRNDAAARDNNGVSRSERAAFIPVSMQALAEHGHQQEQPTSQHRHPRGEPPSPSSSGYRLSRDSGQGTEPGTDTLRSNSVSTLDEHDAGRPKESYDADDADDAAREDGHRYGDFENADLENVSLGLASAAASSRTTRASRIVALASKVAGKISTRTWRVLMLAYNVVDRTILILGFIAFASGIATYGRFFEGSAIFNGLAHWIKGGVFFWLGIFTLGRWAGSFGELGWAWNVRPKSASSRWCPSAEFVESFLIFFYGATNIFLEHLGGAGGPWKAQDLEHISITVLFIGGGLCGMLIESVRLRDLLNTTVTEAVHEFPESNYHDDERETLRPPPTYAFSINPIPALVILLLGIMMSSHTQHSAISSMVHKQWGNLLAGASFARGFTYVVTFLRPPRSILPSRPPTELLASFGLIAGGIIFMASSGDTVAGMIHYQLDEMFMYTVTMGLVGLLMSWVILVVAIKGWAVRKEAGRPIGSYHLS